ncbi:MAG: hypothetical protein AAB426_00360, partial [Myxococcota bacterium]
SDGVRTVQDDACYYPANDQAALIAAFDNIAGQVTSCDYALGTVADATRLYVYLITPGTDGVYGTADDVRTRLDRDGTNGWTYDSITGRATVLGTSCDAVMAGSARPLYVEGCPVIGG